MHPYALRVRETAAVGMCLGLVAVLPRQTRAQSADTSRHRDVAATRDTDPICRVYECGKSRSFLLEQDWFHLKKFAPHTDRNYTMGLGFARSGYVVRRQRHDVLLTLVEAGLDRLLPLPDREVNGTPFMFWQSLRREDRSQLQAFSEALHGTAFTPDSIEDPHPIPGDRPNAFLLGWTVGRTTVNNDRDVAWTSELTVGHVGSMLGRAVQRGIHHALNLNMPEGWDNQLHHTGVLLLGVPTARYGLTYERRLGAVSWKRLSGQLARERRTSARAQDLGRRFAEVTVHGAGDIGYYTMASAGARVRVGSFTSPFWAQRMNPLGMATRVPGGGGVPLEGFFFAGGRRRLVGYNLLLSGYGSSAGPARVPPAQVERWVDEWETGVAVQWEYKPTRSIQLSWAFDAGRSPEFKGPRARSHHWGGLYLTFSRE